MMTRVKIKARKKRKFVVITMAEKMI